MLKKFIEGLIKILTLFSSALLIGIVFCVVLAVLNRTLLKMSIFWTEEVARILYVWFSMVAPAIMIAKEEHFRVSYFSDRILKGRIYALSWFVISFGIVCVLAVLAVNGLNLTYLVRKQQLPTIDASISFMYSAMPVGMITMIFVYILLIIQKIIHIFSKRKRFD